MPYQGKHLIKNVDTPGRNFKFGDLFAYNDSGRGNYFLPFQVQLIKNTNVDPSSLAILDEEFAVLTGQKDLVENGLWRKTAGVISQVPSPDKSTIYIDTKNVDSGSTFLTAIYDQFNQEFLPYHTRNCLLQKSNFTEADNITPKTVYKIPCLNGNFCNAKITVFGYRDDGTYADLFQGNYERSFFNEGGTTFHDLGVMTKTEKIKGTMVSPEITFDNSGPCPEIKIKNGEAGSFTWWITTNLTL